MVSVPTKRGEGVHLCMNHFGNECWFKRFCFCLDLASGSQHMKIFGKECSFELFCLGFVLGSGVPFTMCTFIAIPSVTYIQHRSME